MQRLASLRPFVSFLCFAVGEFAIAAGCWLVAPALGLIAGGAMTVATAVLYERNSVGAA